MQRILTIDEIKALWRRFNRKYENLSDLSPSISKKRENFSSKKLSDAEAKTFEERLEENVKKTNSPSIKSSADVATILQKKFKQKLKQDTLIEVNLNGNHGSIFNHFVNNQKIKRSLNQDKAQELLDALDSGRYSAEIFNDKTLPEVAMSLFSAGKISHHQIWTILERQQTKESFYPLSNLPLVMYPILDSDDQFTEIAKEKLLPNLTKYGYTPSPEQIETFRLLIATLPKSERYFYRTSLGKVRDKRSLAHSIISKSKIMCVDASGDHEMIIHLTAGARDALGLTRFGEDEYIPVMPRLGVETINDIELGVRNHIRYAALSYPGTKSYTENLHNYKEVNDFEATAHDVYHATLMSSVPKNLRHAIWYLVDHTRECFSQRWSKEIWDWIDGEFSLFHLNDVKKNFGKNNDEETNNLLLFFINLSFKNGHFLIKQNRGNTFELSMHAILCILDMFKNPAKWLEFGIDISKIENLNLSENLSDPNVHAFFSLIRDLYKGLQLIYNDIKNDAPKIQVAKVMAYMELKRDHQEHKFPFYSSLIDRDPSNFSFHKVTKKDVEYKKDNNKLNSLILRHNGKEVLSESIIHDLEKAEKAKLNIAEDKFKLNMRAIYESKASNDIQQSKKTKLKFNDDEFERYRQAKNENISEEKAEFIAQPSLTRWMKANPWKSILFFVPIIGTFPMLMYAEGEVINQDLENKSKSKGNGTSLSKNKSNLKPKNFHQDSTVNLLFKASNDSSINYYATTSSLVTGAAPATGPYS